MADLEIEDDGGGLGSSRQKNMFTEEGAYRFCDLVGLGW